ncbi:hypothetical protein [Microcoleus sp. FACHB-831]|nr:hypothetical protein [Microcoleus sp. FACHB-831]
MSIVTETLGIECDCDRVCKIYHPSSDRSILSSLISFIPIP